MKLRVAVIGLGKISEAHILGWKRLDDAEIKVLVDSDGARAEGKAQEYGVAESGTDFNVILERSDIDIVDLVIPHHLHAPYSIAALKAGKHVLVEKPVATKLSDAEEMIKTAESTGKKLMVAEPIRFNPTIQRAATIINENKIGRAFHFTTRGEFYVPPLRFQGTHTGWRGDAEKIGGGVLLESGIHNLAIARFLLGDIEWVSAFEAPRTRNELTVEDTISVIWKFKTGATGLGSFSWATRWLNGVGTAFNVFGTEGVTGSDPQTGRIFLEKDGEHIEWTDASDGPYHGHFAEIKHFVDCIKQNKTPATDAVEETKTLKVILAAYRSAQQNKPINVDEFRE
ncbi:MAG: Gfo/Idh/MocA family oxidoreductase [Thaumarchaeota archaeon]|nr:Gfo/Idh/MocA family oxidoreductase [Nitrososphaerota archaeon]